MRLSLLATFFALVCIPASGVQATSLEITPVAVHLLPGQRATRIEVTNRGGDSTAIQLRAFSWLQTGDEDVLKPTQDVIVSPPIFTVAKGATQTVRILLRGRPPTGEQTFRLLLDEVPQKSGSRQVAIALQISMPVIVAPSGGSPRPLQWRAQRSATGEIVLSARNAGNSHERVQAIHAVLADGSRPKIALRGQNSYVLAGATRQWVFKEATGSTRELLLSVTTRAGKSEQVLVLGP